MGAAPSDTPDKASFRLCVDIIQAADLFTGITETIWRPMSKITTRNACQQHEQVFGQFSFSYSKPSHDPDLSFMYCCGMTVGNIFCTNSVTSYNDLDPERFTDNLSMIDV